MDAIETREYKGLTIEIHVDETPPDPREWDNFGKLICFHRRYNLGDKHEFPEPEDVVLFLKHNKCVYLPVYMYDHSGIGLSTTRDRYPFNCPWDSGQLGVIYVTYEDIKKEFGISRIVSSRIKKVEDMLRNEIETYSAYLEGRVYGYVIERDGEYIDSCLGYYGETDYCMTVAVEQADWFLEHERKEAERVSQITQLCCAP